MFDFLKRNKKAKPQVIHTYQHIVGIEGIRYSDEEKIGIANSAPLFIKVLKNKLLVINTLCHSGDMQYFLKCQGKVEVLEELIGYLGAYKETLEQESTITPVSGRLF